MARISTTRFGGIVPRLEDAPENLADNQAQTAENCDLLAGALRPLRAPSLVTTLPDATRKSVFYYRTEWLSWSTFVRVVRSPVNNDQYDRIYCTGDGVPKVRGLVDDVATEFDLGIEAPTTAPTVTAREKSDTTWSRSWFCYYEEPDGTKADEDTLAEGTDIVVSEGASVFTLASIPVKVAASGDASFVMGFKAYDENDLLIGYVYPASSHYSGNTTLTIDGAQITGELSVGATAVLTLVYSMLDSDEWTTDRVYVYTRVNVWGGESAPSPPSDIVALNPTHEVVVTDMDTDDQDGYFTHLRIYRLVTSSTGEDYQYVDEVEITEAGYVDLLLDSETGSALETDTWIPPPATLAGLVSMPGRFLAGFVDRTVRFSVREIPYAWPEAYGINLPFPIVAMHVTGNSLFVITEGSPYVLVGDDPSGMTAIRVDLPQAGVSAQALADSGSGVVYAATRGFVMAEGGGAQVVTDHLYKRASWDAVLPSTMIAETFDAKIVAFTDATGLLLDPDEQGRQLTTTDETAQGLWNDMAADVLYVIQGASLMQWEGSTSCLTATWRSKAFRFPKPVDFSVVRVVAEAYPVTVKLYAAGALVHTQSITSEEAVRVSEVLRREKVWSVAVETTAVVHELTVAQSIEEVKR